MVRARARDVRCHRRIKTRRSVRGGETKKDRRQVIVGKDDAGLETVAESILHRARALYMYIPVHLLCTTRAIRGAVTGPGVGERSHAAMHGSPATGVGCFGVGVTVAPLASFREG